MSRLIPDRSYPLRGWVPPSTTGTGWQCQPCRLDARQRLCAGDQMHEVSHLSGAACLLVVPAMVAIEVEHVEEIANGWHVYGDVGVVTPHHWIGQVVAAAVAQWLEMPVAFDKLEHRGVVSIRV